MNAPTQQAAPAPAEHTAETAAAEATKTTLEERTSNVLAELRGDKPAPAAAEVIPDAAADRRARLDALKLKDRERVDHKQRQAHADKLQRQAADLERRATEAEASASRRVDFDSLDESAFLALAEKKGITGNKVAEWIRKAVESPEQIAAAAALKATQAAMDPKIAALEATVARQAKQLEDFLTAQQEQQTTARERDQIQQFTSFVEGSADRAPVATKLLAKAPKEFYAMADFAGSTLPEGAGQDALLDAIEELLDGDQGARAVVDQYAELYGYTKTPHSTGKAHPPPRAAAPAPTISNSLAAARTSVVEEDDYASLDLDERARRLIKQLG